MLGEDLMYPLCQWPSENQHQTMPSGALVILWGRIHMYSWYNWIFGDSLNLLCSLQSFADHRCSGKQSCKLHISNLLMTNIKPCPLELSSYFEASYICIHGNNGNQNPLFNEFFFCLFAKFCRQEMLRSCILQHRGQSFAKYRIQTMSFGAVILLWS